MYRYAKTLHGGSKFHHHGVFPALVLKNCEVAFRGNGGDGIRGNGYLVKFANGGEYVDGGGGRYILRFKNGSYRNCLSGAE